MTGQLAFVESPVQLLNVLEWAHTRAPARTPGTGPAPGAGAPAPVTASSTAPAPLAVVVLSPTDPMSRGPGRPVAPRGPAGGRARPLAVAPRGPGAPRPPPRRRGG
ncbi:hypothetical protein ACFUJ0_30480, partial [Streptomyces sp. NPDC057242]